MRFGTTSVTEDGAFVAWTRARAMSLVSERWSSIVSVAAALLEHDTLTGDEVRRLVDDVEQSDMVIPIRSKGNEFAVAARHVSQ